MGTDSDFIEHGPCPKEGCGSSDGMAVYQDSLGRYSGYCYSCESYIKNPYGVAEVAPPEVKEVSIRDLGNKGGTSIKEIERDYPTQKIENRKLSKETCEYFQVRVSFNEGSGEVSEHYYPYFKDGDLVGYKVRKVEGKTFSSKGDMKGSELFGQKQSRAGGKLLVITEGELDCMSAHQIFKGMGKNYNVVSLSSGANTRSIKTNLEFIESFESVVLAYDQDDKGRSAAKRTAAILSPGKAKIMSLSEKDISELLVKGKAKELYGALGSAKEYRPDGIIRLSQAYEELFKNDMVESVPYPWEGINKKLYGLRKSELVTITSGTGMGKSECVRKLQHHLFKETTDTIGILALEESIGRTQWGIMSVEARLPLHILEERKDIPEEKIRGWWESTIGSGRFVSYDHFGSTSEDNLINKVWELIKGMGCQWIILDHLSIVVSSMEDGGDERRTIDSIMTRLRQLVEETKAGMILVSHLRRPSGDKGHEQGVEVSLSHLRGSQAIAQLSDAVISLERNQQALNEKEANLTTVRVLKNRYAGLTGIATYLYYDKETSMLEEVLDREKFLLDAEEDSQKFEITQY